MLIGDLEQIERDPDAARERGKPGSDEFHDACRGLERFLEGAKVELMGPRARPLLIQLPVCLRDFIDCQNAVFAGPGVGSFEAALLAVAAAFGRSSAELAELIIEYDPHPPLGTGMVERANPNYVAMFEGLMSDMVAQYRTGAIASLEDNT